MDNLPEQKNDRVFNTILDRRRFSTIFIFLLSVFALSLWHEGFGRCQGWSDTIVRLLPDDSFAVIEKDERGRKIRHCPHHDTNGKLDEEQLIYMLGTIDRETWVDPDKKATARKHLENHYNKFIKKVIKKGLERPVILNYAKLTEIVALPQIGPALAVKIVEYRSTHSRYETIEDIKNVEGIGPGIFNAIKPITANDGWTTTTCCYH